MSKLVNPLTSDDLRDLTNQGVTFQVDTSNVRDRESDDDDENENLNKEQYLNKECIGLFDEETYEEGAPFEIIAQKMFNLIPSGKIKKRILRQGDGEKPEDKATVKVHYNGYFEYDDKPFDSTYIRNRPHKFIVNDGRVIPGLDFSVQSMKLNEKSQFLIHPDYAYRNSLFGRCPANSQVLFEIELIEVINSGAAITYEKLPEEQQKTFEEVYKYCSALSENGKKSFIDHDFKSAIKNYNTAVSKIERVMLMDKGEVEKHRELSMKLYTNLLICYTMTREARKGVANAKKIYDLTQNGELIKIPAKVFYNHGKCLRVLSDYDGAKEMLEKANKMAPKNPDIANELINLQNDKEEHRKKQLKFAHALVSSN